MKADIRRRLEAALVAPSAVEERVLISELAAMVKPLGVPRQRISAALGVLKITMMEHSNRVTSVTPDEAERIINWLLATRRVNDRP